MKACRGGEEGEHQKKKCPPMCSLLSFLLYSFTEFLHSLCMQSHVWIYGSSMLISTKRECSGFQSVLMASRRRHRRIFGFIYDAMNSECAKMDFRFAESTVNSWTCFLSLSLSRGFHVLVFIAIPMPRARHQLQVHIYLRICCDCDDGNLFKFT